MIRPELFTHSPWPRIDIEASNPEAQRTLEAYRKLKEHEQEREIEYRR